MITTYTTYDDIRAVLGVSDDELEDDTLSLEVYDNALTVELEDIDLDLPATYAALPTTLTAAQQRFQTATRLFATYSVAKQLSSALPLFGPKDISDGKATVSRFSDSPYKEVIKRIEAEYEKSRTRLEKAYATANSSSYSLTIPTFLSVASPNEDPITG